LLNYLWPALILVFSVFLLGKRPHLLLVPGTLISILGVLLVLTQGASISWSSFSRNVASNPPAYFEAAWFSWASLPCDAGRPQSNGGLLFTGRGLCFVVTVFMDRASEFESLEMLFTGLPSRMTCFLGHAMRDMSCGELIHFMQLHRLASHLYLNIDGLNLWLVQLSSRVFIRWAWFRPDILCSEVAWGKGLGCKCQCESVT
jgi:hypothetical protein